MARKAPRIGVVIPAGGRGARMGGEVPKQFLKLKGVPVLQRTVKVFEDSPQVSEIVVVVPEELTAHTERLIRRAKFRKVSHVTVGGRERQHSVRNGLLSFNQDPDIVLVHDAVRPLVSQEVIRQVIDAAKMHDAAVVGVRVKDTIKIEESGFYKKTLDRSRLWAVQTPQGFSFDLLKKAHLSAQRSAFIGTDEAMLVERIGVPVKIVEGDYSNVKITTPDDLKVAKLLLDL